MPLCGRGHAREYRAVRERRRLERGGRDESCRAVPARKGRRGVVDRAPNALIGAAPAKVAVHPPTKRGVVGGSIRIEQRDRREGLARLAVTALHDVVAMPRITHRVGDRPGHTLNGGDLLADGAPGLRLAGLLVLSVHEDRARSTEPASQPNFVPFRPRTSRRTHSSGVEACRSSTSKSEPFTVSRTPTAPLFPRTVTRR